MIVVGIYYSILGHRVNLGINVLFLCRFKDYLEGAPSYNYSRQYLHVTLARLVFIIFFQYVVFFVKDLLAWLVPDVPKSLEIKIKREQHVARVCLRKSEVEATREVGSTTPYQSCESLPLSGVSADA